MILRSVLLGIRRLLQNSPALKQLTVDLVKLLEWDVDHVFVLHAQNIRNPFETNLSSQGLYFDQRWEQERGVYFLEGKDAKPELMCSFIRFLLLNTTNLKKLVVRLGGNVAKLEFEKLARMTHIIGIKYNVSMVLKLGFVRSFTSPFWWYCLRRTKK